MGIHSYIMFHFFNFIQYFKNIKNIGFCWDVKMEKHEVILNM